MIIRVPKSLEVTAKRDLGNFIKDIANFTQRGSRPFIRRLTSLKNMRLETYNPFNFNSISFEPTFKCNDRFLRYMHIDLSYNRDSVGLSCCHIPEFVEIEKYDPFMDQIYKTYLPLIKFDFWGKIFVRKGAELIFSDVREVIYELSRRGFYFGLITFDRFQSIDSVQILRRQGYTVTHLSIDKTSNAIILDSSGEFGFRKVSTEGNTNAAMQCFKDSLYDDRIKIPSLSNYYDLFYPEEEAKNAQEAKSGKIDHPPGGWIDVLQSIAGSAFNATNNEILVEMSGTEKAEQAAQDSYYADMDKAMTEQVNHRGIKNNYEDDLLQSDDPYSIFEKPY